MTAAILVMLLRALPSLEPALAGDVANALSRALSSERSIDPALAVAVLALESGGDPRACANDAYGGSSRGLFQIRVPKSRCRHVRLRADLWDIRKNARAGVAILAMQLRRAGGDLDLALRRYSGGARGYAAKVTKLAERIR